MGISKNLNVLQKIDRRKRVDRILFFFASGCHIFLFVVEFRTNKVDNLLSFFICERGMVINGAKQIYLIVNSHQSKVSKIKGISLI